jgi:3',5'-cyclic AMP phosphodiesterase CpdA
MKILVLSDLHLAHARFLAIHAGERIYAQADVVVLAGDIDDGVGGFRWARETFPDKPIVYVAGNHEFYGYNWIQHLETMREAANKYDIDFLETDGIDLGGVRFLGCSLWTDFELFGADRKSDAMKAAKASMMDYQYIKLTRTAEFYWVTSKRLIPALTERRHRGSIEWLEDKLKNGGDPAKTVIVTHHAPHPLSMYPMFAKDLLSASYVSDLSRLMGKAGLWIHGHMHNSVDYVVNGTRVVCNPRGYPHKNGGVENGDFDPAFLVEI